MIQLSTITVRILEASHYSTDPSGLHHVCDVCDAGIYAGQIEYTNGAEWFHTGCALPGVRVHELHALVSGGAR
jgi:hypothetical protein